MKKLLVALVVGALLALPMSAMAMDALTQNQLDAVEGQAGLTVGFGSAVITEISFDSLSWGDPDGVATTNAAAAGWLIMDGTIGITSTIAQGGQLVMDVATTSAAFATNGLTIPNAKTFLYLSLPTMSIDVSVPSNLAIGFGTAASTITCTLGNLALENLSVSMNSIDALYVWCH